jgi:CheY-like chemotaxis protein
MSAVRILIADDEPHIRRVLELKLQGAGFQVRATSSAKEALQAAQEFAPHLVVSDYKMPGDMTGVDLVMALRQTPATAETPIILLTGSVAVLHKLQEVLAGVPRVTILSKPFSPRTLLQQVNAILEAAAD